MKIFQPLNANYRIEKPSKMSEFEIHAALYIRLRQAGYKVRGHATAKYENGMCTFDLVVFDGDYRPKVIIEVKNSANTSLPNTRQGMRYRHFGLPVVLFWNLDEYGELLNFLRSTIRPNVIEYSRAVTGVRGLRTRHSLTTREVIGKEIAADEAG